MPNKYEIAFRIAGELSKQFAASFNGAGASIVSLTQKLKELNERSLKQGGLPQLQNKLAAATEAVNGHLEKIKSLEAAYQKGAMSESEFAERNRKLTATLARLKQEQEAAKQSLEGLARETGAASVKESDLQRSVANTTNELNKTYAAYERVVRLTSRGDRFITLGASMRRSAMETAVSMRVMGGMITSALTTPIREAMKMEDAMADVAKVVQFKDPKGLGNLQAALENMSLDIPMTADGLAQIAAAAGQSGIAADEIEAFTRQAAQMGIAFDITAGQAGEMMAKWRSGMKLTQTQTVELADAANELANANAAQAAQIGEVLLRYGALGKVAGLTEKQVAALSASVIAAGAAPEVAATGINAFVRALGKGGTMTKKQAEAFGSIGFNATQLQKDMQKNAPQVILGVLQRIRDKVSKEQQSSFLTSAFGEEGARTLGPLLTNLEGLQKNFELVGDKSRTSGSMLKEFKSRSDTTSNSLQLLRNSISYIVRNIGNPLLTPLAEYARGLAEKAKVVGDWVKNNQELVAVLTKAGIGIGAFALAFQGLKAAILFSFSPLMSLVGIVSNMAVWCKTLDRTSKLVRVGMFAWSAACKVATVAFGLVTTAIKGVGIALRFMFMNPVGLAITAIAGLIAGGVMLYRNWDKVCAWFQENFPQAFAVVQAGIENAKKWFKPLIDFVSNVFAGNWEGAWNNLMQIVSNLFGGLVEIAKKPINTIIGLINKAIGGINSIGSVKLPFLGDVGINIPPIPKLATGGIVAQPTLAQIGEGSEPEAVLPLSKLSGMLSQRPVSQASPVNVTFSPVINLQGAGQDAYESVRRGVEDAQREFEARMRRFLADQQRLSFA